MKSVGLKDLTIVVPCYNEEDSLEAFLGDLGSFVEEHACKAIIINDGSTDNTAQALNCVRHNDIQIVHHKVNKGYGGAIKTGIQQVQSKYCITIDSDGQHKFSDIKSLYNKIVEASADLVIGSRPRNNHVDYYRACGKWIIRSVAKMLMKMPVADLNSGMKIYDTALVKRYLNLCPDGMAFSDIITLTFVHQKHLVLENEIDIDVREAGCSTVNSWTAVNTVFEIVNIIMLFNPLRIFIPLSAISFVIGSLWSLPFLIAGRGMSTFSSLLILSSFLFFSLGLIAEQLSRIRKLKID